jgi:hypothetical protein
MMDHRFINAAPGRAPDRGIFAGQLSDNDGVPVGDWIKLQPFENVYDTQANSNYFNCTFDPIDDGNSEEDFFDPSDPGRFQGPSSTCTPGFTFADQGETGSAFQASAIGDASDGPGLSGATGLGTWIQPKVDLARFRGRRMRFRFLQAGLKLGGFVLYDDLFMTNPDPRDDGWFIDDFTISDALTTPASVSSDTGSTVFATCAVTCPSDPVAAVSLDPVATGAPGQVVELDASGSTVATCIGGVLQYQFWVDSDRSGSIGGPDILLRDFTDNDAFLDVPQGDTSYLVAVRCASDPSCLNVVSSSVSVACPTGPGGLSAGSSTTSAFLEREPEVRRDIFFTSKTAIEWVSGATADVMRGDLGALRTSNGFTGGTGGTCLAENAINAISQATGADDPAAGGANFYLARSGDNCNLKAGGSWGGVRGGTQNRDADLGDGICVE